MISVQSNILIHNSFIATFHIGTICPHVETHREIIEKSYPNLINKKIYE